MATAATTNALHDMHGIYRDTVPEGAKRIAWDGISFCVPGNWELAVYKSLRRGARRIEVEDEFSIRMESEWIRTAKRPHLKRIMKRYEEASKPLTLKADTQSTVEGLPEGWLATHFEFKETGVAAGTGDLTVTEHELVTAFYVCPRTSLFCFFLLHVLPEDSEDPVAIMRLIAQTFQDHGAESFVPWELFDISFRVPREFALENTQFDIGMKLMVFGWKLRRYFLWHLSCADIFLKHAPSPAEWVCGHLNGARMVKGVVFHPDGRGGIVARRRKPFVLGHREEIARLCYRYAVGFYVREESNQLVIWVYNHRKADDVTRMLGSLRPGPHAP